jgi:hypothetical protein
LDEFDRLINDKFGFIMSRSHRNRRKQARGPDGGRLGLANVHYLRFERSWILLASKGRHRFFDEHVKRDARGEVVETFFRDVRRDPIFFAGYSIRIAEGGYLSRRLWSNPEVPECDTRPRVRVRIAHEAYADLKADFLERAKSSRWSVEDLERAIFTLPYLPYAPVREQLRDLIRWVNRARRERGLSGQMRLSCIRRKIPAVRAFVPDGHVSDVQFPATFDTNSIHRQRVRGQVDQDRPCANGTPVQEGRARPRITTCSVWK